MIPLVLELARRWFFAPLPQWSRGVFLCAAGRVMHAGARIAGGQTGGLESHGPENKHWRGG